MKIFERLKKITSAINVFAEYFTGVLMLVTIVCGCVQVFSRYIFKVSVPWTEELARFLFVWLTLLGASCAAKKAKHIKVDSFVDNLKGRAKTFFSLLTSFILIIFYGLCVRYGYSYVLKGALQAAAVTRLNMGVVYASVPVSFGLMLIYEIEHIADTLFEEYVKGHSSVTGGFEE